MIIFCRSSVLVDKNNFTGYGNCFFIFPRKSNAYLGAGNVLKIFFGPDYGYFGGVGINRLLNIIIRYGIIPGYNIAEA